METLKRSRNHVADSGRSGRLTPGKRARTEASEMSPPKARTQPVTLLAAAPTRALSPALLRPAGGPPDSSHLITPRLQTVVHEGWARKSASHTGVKVLMVFWEADSPDLGKDITSLQKMLSDNYNYHVEKLRLKSNELTRDAVYQATDFVRRNFTGESLLILYYVGQSSPNPKSGELPLWTSRRAGSTSIQSGPIQSLFDDADCDAILLYDACIHPVPLQPNGASHATRAIKSVTEAPAAGFTKLKTVTEVLAAGTFNGHPIRNNNGSAFTQALVNKLSAVPKSGLRLTDLQSQLAKSLVTLKPRGRGRPPKDPQLRAMDGQHVPVNAWVSGPNRHLTLLPFKINTDPEVILCFRMKTNVPEWVAWIGNAHDSIVVEGTSAGASTMLILRVPFNVWEQLPECPTEGLIGFSMGGIYTERMAALLDEALAKKLYKEEPDHRLGPMPPLGPRANTRVESATNSHATAARVVSSPPRNIPHVAAGEVEGDDDDDGGYSLRASPKKTRKALPSGRKLLPSESMAEPESSGRDQRELPGGQGRAALPTEHKLLAPGRNGAKVSIQSASQLLYCGECKSAGFKDDEALAAHRRKQHVRPFHCVFHFAGCDSTFASKNEWKRHVMSQHILLYVWVCQLDTCNKSGGTSTSATGVRFSSALGHGQVRGGNLPPGSVFNRKDLFTQHLRRMHAPPALRAKPGKSAKSLKTAANEGIGKEWEEQVKHLQQVGQKDRIKLPSYLRCPAKNCSHEFTGLQAWDDRMEHVAKHLEAAARDLEDPVIFGGIHDRTLLDWSMRADVGIVFQMSPGDYRLDNPLNPMRPRSVGTDGTAEYEHDHDHNHDYEDDHDDVDDDGHDGEHDDDDDEHEHEHEPERDRSKSVIEVGVGAAYSPDADEDNFEGDMEDDEL